MISKLLHRAAAGLFGLLLAVVASASPAAQGGPKVAVVAFGLFGDQSVFESEANGAARIVAKNFGGGPVIVRANSKTREDATIKTLTASLRSAAKTMFRSGAHARAQARAAKRLCRVESADRRRREDRAASPLIPCQ